MRMGILKSLADGVRSLGEAGKELFSGIGSAIAKTPEVIATCYKAKQETVREVSRLQASLGVVPGVKSAAAAVAAPAQRPSAGTARSSVEIMPAIPAPASFAEASRFDRDQAKHEREMLQAAHRARLAEGQAAHEWAMAEIEQQGQVDRRRDEHRARLDQENANHRAGLDRQTAEHAYLLDQRRLDAAYFREISPFADVHPADMAAAVAQLAGSTTPALMLAPMRRLVAGSEQEGRDQIFDEILEERVTEQLMAQGIVRDIPGGLLRRPLYRKEADLLLIRRVLADVPVILVHGTVMEGRGISIHFLAWNLFADPTQRPAAVDLARTDEPRFPNSPVPQAIRLTLPFGVSPDDRGRQRTRDQERTALAAAAVSAMFGEWFAVAAGQEPSLSEGTPSSLAPVPQTTAVGLGAVLDIAVERGLREQEDALLAKADVYRLSGFTDYARESARRAARIITPGDHAEQRRYLDRVDRLAKIFDALQEGGQAAALRAKAEQVARQANRSRLYGDRGVLG